MKLVDIEGIGPAYAAKLSKAGIRSLEALLKKGATPAGRKEVARMSGIGDANILEWVNLADLFRIKGVGGEYSDLLEEAGVDTVVELAKRSGANLFKKMEQVNAEKKLVRKMPTAAQVEGWIQQAKKLPRAIKY